MKKLFLFMLVLFIAGLAFADTVVVGTGTQVSRFPLGSYYGYERSAALYTDTELGPQNSRISEIAWYTNTATSVSVPTKIYLKTTASTTLTNDTWATMIAGAVLVYDATHTGTVAGGWNNFVLSNTFDVDDGYGLIILVERNYGGGGNGTYSGAGVNATNYTGGHLYWNQDNSAPTGNGYTSSIRPNVTITYTTYTISGPPNNAAISSPADGATGVALTATLNWASGGGAPTGYKLSFGTDNPPTNIVNNVDMGNVTTYDPNPDMAYSTTYYWKVVAYNGNGDAVGTPVWSFTTMADPTQPLPYTQDFNSGTSLAAINWTGDMLITANHGTNGSNGLYRNMYSYVTTCNAVTPPIGPMSNDCQILFDYRIVNYSGYPGTGTTLGANDKIEVQISNGGSYSTIYTIDQNNHVTSNAFAGVTIPVTAYAGNIINVKFLCTWGAGDYYVDIDNVLVRETPQGGLLTVNPNPVNCGTSYVGIQKTVQVSLTNTGVAAFDVTSIALADYTNFNLANLPALPVTINSGAPAVTFDVVFTATVTGPLTTNLLINDTRQASSIVVNGTGVQALVGEICENPYLATLPLVDYAGTTNGYANDYTAAMFTGLGHNSYVQGPDWVAKVSIPEDGWLDISLANPSGDATNYYPGIFLVNTIPSLANPATVLAQHYNYTAPVEITDAVVSAGDYYVIVDNWAPSPDYINFVLNISFQPFPSGPVAAPNLDYPADRQTDLPKTGFPFQFSWNLAGAEPEQYDLWIAKASDLTITPYDPDEFFNVAVEFPNVTSPYQPAYTYDYSEVYVWTVLGSRGTDPVQFQWPPYEFTIVNPPLVIDYIPYGDDFETHGDDTLPTGWTRSSQGEGWIVSTDHSSEYWTIPAHTVYASANDDALGSGNDGSMDLLTLPLFDLSGITENNFQLKFDSYFTGAYGQLADVEISVNGGAWTSIYSVPIATEWTEHTVNLSAYKPNQFQLRFHSDDDGSWASGWAIDNVIIERILDYDAAVASIDMMEVYYTEAITPKATVVNNGVQPATFTVTMVIGDTYSEVQTVTALPFNATQQVTFPVITPELWHGYGVTVTVALAGDEDTTNDEMTSAFYCLPIDKQAYGDATYSLTTGPMTFNLKNPEVITDLSAADPLTNFLAGADWMNGGWYGSEHNTTNAPFWQIDPTTGAGTQIGLTGYPSFTGVAYDSNHDILYGCTTTALYTINPTTGVATWLADLSDPNGWSVYLLSIAYDTWNDILYAHDIAYDALFVIDTTTYEISPATGYNYGLNFNYQQDLAFDRENGLLYLAGTVMPEGLGVLYWIDPWYASAWKIGSFQADELVSGFAIPYIDHVEIEIAADGTISWDPVTLATGGYNIYAADDPYGEYSLVANTTSTSWLDPNFPENMKFYYVTAVGTGIRQAVQPQMMPNLKRGEPIVRTRSQKDCSSLFTPKTK